MPEVSRGGVAKAIRDTLCSPNVADSNLENANVVDALDSIGQSLRYGLKWLGTGDAATPMGAIEAHAAMMNDPPEEISGALREVAEAGESIADALQEVAKAIRERGSEK
jgi:hypothetical protein